MKYLPLVWAALWRKKARTIFTFLSVVIAFILFGILAGVSGGFDHILQSSRLDRLFTDPKFGTPLPYAYAEQIQRVPGVKVVAPRMFLPGYYKQPRDRLGVIATDARFFAVRPEILASKADIAAMLKLRTGAIVGRDYQKRFGWKVGDKISIIAPIPTKDGSQVWTFDVVAVVDDAINLTSNWFIANYKYLDERRAGGNGKSDRLLIIINDPTQSTQISRRIDAMFANSPAPTRSGSERASAEANLRSLGDINFLTRAVVGAVLFMLLILTGNTMMQSVRERIPEFAVLKTLGFSDVTIQALVLAEAVLLCILAGVAGLVIVKASMPLLTQSRAPLASLLVMPWSAFAQGMGFALAMALISSAFPALRIHRLSVVDALRR